MIGLARDGDVLTIRIQRPERRNALNAAVIDELRTTFEGAASDGVKAIVLTGEGSVFCSGMDLSGAEAASAENLIDEMLDKAIALNAAIDHTPVPVVAAINGPVIGAGVQLAIICDLRVVDANAYFQLPVAKYGLAADTWTVRRLTSLVGYGRARGMLMAAQKLPADEALLCGMANRIGTVEDAQQWAQEIAGLAPLSLRHAKRVLNDDGAWETERPVHQDMFEAAWKSQDAVEAQVARFQKRSPSFQGR
ncbi:enoyl-CoA hydratase [Mycobacterium gordonae]|uniref:Enoyl-CoA hydratase n=1 Tax=Mycobacterium gordonae TaxID=1778 RepID=A0A0Q2LZ07_MYCGO|nr:MULTISPECIES: enoyl-CoA hydratase [Mycobacterium]KQH81057.1 enoyl-CoA hydratase [Mycobacterium gordonae]MDP7731181.1 enoyl-CoA hydratase [Mycobacterium sp. TY813]